MNFQNWIARSTWSLVPALLVAGSGTTSCLAPPIAEMQAKQAAAAKGESADRAPTAFYDATWADCSGKDGKGGTKITTGAAKNILPLREDGVGKKTKGDASMKAHPDWFLFHSLNNGSGKSLAFEWKWTTSKEDKFYGNMWAGAGLAFNTSWSNINITGAKYLVMYAKAIRDDLNEMEFTVKLHDGAGDKGQTSTKVDVKTYAEGKKIGTEWTRVVIPMKAFSDADRLDLTHVKTVDFDLAGKYPENEALWVRLDNVYFSDAEMLTPVENVGYAIAKDGVRILWDKAAGEKIDKFVVAVDGKEATTVDGSKREAKVPLALFPPKSEHRVTVVAASAKELSSPQGTKVVVPAGAPEVATVSVDGKPLHEISPYLFGSNWMSPESMKETNTTINRWGGNTTSTYNWKSDNDNKGNDWFFLDDFSKPDGTPETEKGYYKFIKNTLAAGADVNFTIATGPFIAKGHPSGGRYCSYPTKVFPEQDKTDGQGCGNGMKPGGKEIIWGNDPNLSMIPNSPEYQKGLVENIKKLFGGAAGKGVKFYTIDNEPGLWHGTHRDAVPKGISTDDLIDFNVKYASMIKSVDADAKVIGFAAWGVLELAGSNVDMMPTGPDGYKNYDKPSPADKWRDRKAHGNQPQLVSYLKAMKSASEKAGKRLIDVVDIHWYPECYGKDSKGETKRLSDDNLSYDAVTAAKQFDAVREWYDPTYKAESSWTADSDENRKMLWDPFHPVIPALKKMVEEAYPGTKLAFNEYATGSPNYYHGALIRAAVLGYFMQEDVYMAQNWSQGDSKQPAYWAQRLYGNFDGKGGKVRGKFLKSTSSHKDLLSFATEHAGKKDIVLINKNSTSPINVTLKLPGAAKSFMTYALGEGVGQRIVESGPEPAKGQEVSILVPAYSALVVVAQ
jgi:Glycoside hydrolase family 44